MPALSPRGRGWAGASWTPLRSHWAVGCGVPERRPLSLSLSHPGSLLTTGRDAAVLWECWGLQAVYRPSCLGWGWPGYRYTSAGSLGTK